MASLQVMAMSLLHGDHTASSIAEGRVATAAFLFHDVGSPWTILVKGWVCDSYNFRTIDSWGVTKSAE